MVVDLSVYLVTDSTPAILKGRDLLWVVEESLKGGANGPLTTLFILHSQLIYVGVTVVQYRDKTSDTGVLVETARKLYRLTQAYGVPLLINDRVDVAVAVGCDGVHLGQDDMSESPSANLTTHLISGLTITAEIEMAKRLLPKNAIIGISASSIEEAKKAIADGADYLGIGTTFATST